MGIVAKTGEWSGQAMDQGQGSGRGPMEEEKWKLGLEGVQYPPSTFPE